MIKFLADLYYYMGWKVEITGDKSDLEELSKRLVDKDLSIVKEDTDFVLKSENLDILSNYKEVKSEIGKLLDIVNVIAQLTLDPREVIKYNNVFWLDETKRIFIESEIGMSTRVCICENSLSDRTSLCSSIKNWTKIEQDDNNVKDVFKLIVHSFNLVSLCKIIEILQKDDFKPIKKGGAYFKEVNRLNQSANSYKATGVESRHHLDRNEPPDSPMLLPEAKALMRTILCQWLVQKEQNRLNQKE